MRNELLKIILIVIGITPWICSSQSYRDTDQIQIAQRSGYQNNSIYTAGHGFEDVFSTREDLSFTNPKPDFYAKNKVKTVCIYNVNGQLFYRCELNEKGDVVQRGKKGRNFFIQTKKVELNKSHTITEVGYYSDTVLMRLDSTNIQVHKYLSGDTIMTYHEKQLVTYMMGSLINQKNRYLNEHYLDKKIETPVSPFGPEPDSRGSKRHQIYLKKKLRTDYDSLDFYLVQDVRFFMTPFHLVNDTEIPWESVQNHFFYETFKLEKVENFAVDGADFDEPIQYHEQMFCGNSDYLDEVWDGRNYSYTTLENGLYEAYQLYYYPVDPNPQKQESKTTDTLKFRVEEPFVEMEEIIAPGPPRLSTPEISVIYSYRYEFFE